MQENGYYEKYKRSFINSCVSRTFFNLRAMKSGEGVCCVQRAIADTISRELEFGEQILPLDGLQADTEGDGL